MDASLSPGAAPTKEQVEQLRVDIQKMANEKLERLYKTQPSAQKAIKKAAGYAVFSNFGMKILFAGGGSGKGLAVDNKSGKNTFMKLVEVQAGLGMGIKKFRLIWVFENKSDLDSFINSGWEFGGQASAAAQASGEGVALAGAMSVKPGVWIYQLTDDGLALELTTKGTKYYKDNNLNWTIAEKRNAAKRKETNIMKRTKQTILFLAISALAMPALAQQDFDGKPSEVSIGTPEYSPYLDQGWPNRVYFGDTHLHTSFSTDAGMYGTRLEPDEAYEFARGEEVISNTGLRVRLQRPLDFLVVADHAENLGLALMIEESNPELLTTQWGRMIHDMVKSGDAEGAYEEWGKGMQARQDPLAGNDALNKTMWERLTVAAEKYNQPGQFTAFIGFEWTSSPDGDNLHRNVVFRGDGDEADQVIPFSTYDSSDPEDLWQWMSDAEKQTGSRLLAIPHNGNLSSGLMFDDVTLTTKKRIDRDYAERRMRWEPLYEITQIKGDGEAHSVLSPNDEFADFETWDKGAFGATKHTEKMLPNEYAREAFKRGLAYEEKLGVNPFKFGVIGSTDSHTGLATTTEDNFFGKISPLEPSAEPDRFEEVITGIFNEDPAQKNLARNSSASGLAAVWATDNTREALWDAMSRKEVYATTGTRLLVRVFAGFDFAADDIHRHDFAKYGYQKGVPMGGDLSKAPDGKAPSFLIRALRDVDGANLDRAQVVKGWMDAKGKLHEKVYDVAWSGDRQIGADGKLPPVGNTVDVADASYTNTIGAPLLLAYWQDPEFDAKQKAFYYVRVIEIPTPRWTTYDAKFFKIDLPEGVPTAIQDRAYTTPIWYTP